MDANHYQLSDEDGTVVEFTQAIDGKWVVTRTWTSQSPSTTTYVYGTTADRALLKRVIAPTESGIGDCAAAVPAKGCRVLEYDYAATTTASASGFGDFEDRVRAVKVWSWDPVADVVNAVEVSHYAYDIAGHLREVWDPRLDWTNEAVHHLKTKYNYNVDGILEKSSLRRRNHGNPPSSLTPSNITARTRKHKTRWGECPQRVLLTGVS